VIEKLLNSREIAELLGLSSATVLNRFEDGSLPGFRLFAGKNKIGRPTGAVRFRESEVLEWIESMRVEVKT
jgi:predicted DNA-binding transcriptional regulator AlpA